MLTSSPKNCQEAKQSAQARSILAKKKKKSGAKKNQNKINFTFIFGGAYFIYLLWHLH